MYIRIVSELDQQKPKKVLVFLHSGPNEKCCFSKFSSRIASKEFISGEIIAEKGLLYIYTIHIEKIFYQTYLKVQRPIFEEGDINKAYKVLLQIIKLGPGLYFHSSLPRTHF